MIRLRWAYELSNGSLVVFGGKTPLNDARRKRGSFDSVLQVRSPDGTRVLQEYKDDADVNEAAAYGMDVRLAAFRVYGQVAISGADKRLGSEDTLPKIDVFDLERGQRLCRLDVTYDSSGEVPENLSSLQAFAFAFSPDGKRAVALSENGMLRFYDLPAPS